MIIGAGDVEFVVRDKTYNGKHFFYDFLHEWLGTGLLTSNGGKWQKRRKLITPAFHFNILKSFAPIMNKNASTMARIIYSAYETKENLIFVCFKVLKIFFKRVFMKN